MNDNLQKYRDAITKARSGDSGCEQFLRKRLKTMADVLPIDILLWVSEAIADGRGEQLRGEAERN